MQDTYIDDFTRAGRDMEEWLKFARISKRMKRGIIGVSDGFGLNGHDGKMKIGMLGVLSDMQTQGLREKVKRGMKGAVSRGTCIGKLALGFTRQICRDENGNIIRRPDGSPRHKPCIDPETSPRRLEIFELYVTRNWSLNQIAKHFNTLKVDGSDGWTFSSIKKLLSGSDAIGIFEWGHEHREYERDLEKHVVSQNPESEWVTYEDPDLTIVPKSLWEAAQEKLEKQREAHPRTGKPWSQNQKSATTLFSGTLFCGYCKSEIKLNRSTKDKQVMACLHGPNCAHDCKLSSSKSVTIIEKCLLGYIEDFLLTESVIKDLVQRANVFFKQEARKPQVDTTPMKAEVRKKQAAIKMYFERIEKNLGKPVCEEYEERIGKLRTEIDSLKETIREAEVHNGRPLKPLDFKQVKAYLADLRKLLCQEIPMAAEAIRTLTGPIKIRQEKIPGKRGARWIASFSPNLLALLQKVAGDKGSPLAESFQAVPSDLQPVEVFVEKVTKYERLAPKFKKMRDDGASVRAIASAHQMSWVYAKQILDLADTGKRPDWGSDKRQCPDKKSESDTPTVPGFGKPTKYIEIAPEVVRLRKQKMSFAKIATKLGVSEATVTRAYDHGCPKAAREAVENGTPSKRGSYSHLGEKVFQKIRKLLRAGMEVKEIAQKVGCGTSTVYRLRAR